MTRVIAIGGIGEANPFGKVFLAEVMPSLVAKYRFQKYPTSLADLKASDGTVFENGFAPECGTILKLIAYSDGLTIESRAHSEDGKRAIISMLDWFSSEHNLQLKPESIKRWLYVTDLVFYADVNLTSINSAFAPICDAMSAYNETLGRKQIEFQLSSVKVDYDHSVLEFPQTGFLIERDKQATFAENKYFSESPFPSERHLELLEEFERGLLSESR